MRLIPLSNYGVSAIVDDDDYDRLNKHKWGLSNGYPCRYTWNPETLKKGKIYMHRCVINTKKGRVTDHINRNKLDNRKKNLRETTQFVNRLNSSKRKNKSGVTGVFKHRYSWGAHINVMGKSIHLGCFKLKKDAIKARKYGEKKYHSGHLVGSG